MKHTVNFFKWSKAGLNIGFTFSYSGSITKVKGPRLTVARTPMKDHQTKRIELPNQEKIRKFKEKESYKALEANIIKQAEMIEKLKKQNLRQKE